MEAFIEHLEISSTVQIQNFGGVSELPSFLSVFVKMREFQTVTRVGVVRDAETNAESAFQGVQSALQNAGLQPPSRVASSSDGSPGVIVLILPGNLRQGMLETLLCETFAGTPEDECISEFFQCLPPNIPAHRMPKARAHAWIATRRDPHVSVGVAAKKHFWNLDHTALNPVRDFLLLLSSPDVEIEE